MMNKKEFTKIAKNIIHPRPKFRSAKLIYPSREWIIGLIAITIFIVVSAYWSAQLYVNYKNTSIREVLPVQEGAVVYRESLVGAALNEFSDRNRIHESLLNGNIIMVEEETEDENVLDESTATSSEDMAEEVISESSTTTDDGTGNEDGGNIETTDLLEEETNISE